MVLFLRRKPHRKGDWSIEFLGSMFKLFMIAFPLGVSAFSLLAMRLQLGPFTGVLSETWREVTRKVGTSWNRLTIRSCRCSSATSQRRIPNPQIRRDPSQAPIFDGAKK